MMDNKKIIEDNSIVTFYMRHQLQVKQTMALHLKNENTGFIWHDRQTAVSYPTIDKRFDIPWSIHLYEQQFQFSITDNHPFYIQRGTINTTRDKATPYPINKVNVQIILWR